MACCITSKSSTRCSLLMSACGNIGETCPHCLHGRAAILTGNGGKIFYAIAEALGFGMKAIYDDVPRRIGFGAFAPVIDAHGTLFSASRRIGRDDVPNPAVEEAELR